MLAELSGDLTAALGDGVELLVEVVQLVVQPGEGGEDQLSLGAVEGEFSVVIGSTRRGIVVSFRIGRFAWGPERSPAGPTRLPP